MAEVAKGDQSRAELEEAFTILLQDAVSAHLATLGRRKGERFIRAYRDRVMGRATASPVVPIRAASNLERKMRAGRLAAAIFEDWWPALLGSLSADD